MPHTACYRELFQPNTPVFYSLSFQPITTKVGGWTAIDMQRPYIPYAGGVLDVPSGAFVPDTIANNQANVIAFTDYFAQVRQASLNFYDDVVGTVSIDPLSPFAGYLAKKTKDNTPAWTRYIQLAGIVTDFWNTADPAWTITQYNSALNGLIEKIKSVASNDLYIPNALYQFDNANAFAVDFAAWKVANPAIAGFLTVEFWQ